MKRMYENEREELRKILKKAKMAGAATSLDFALVNQDTRAGQADWEMILEKVLPYVDFFVPSAEELCFMAKNTSLIQNAPGNPVSVCWVNTLSLFRLFRLPSVNTPFLVSLCLFVSTF
ncbi:PfkB domain-containing protein [Clostridium saccharolyticum WM1] [Clostridioides difficile]|nr:PfkB domain-containing protein [Clostridium saccharolyticum WM1] [Clostridioides difficile]